MPPRTFDIVEPVARTPSAASISMIPVGSGAMVTASVRTDNRKPRQRDATVLRQPATNSAISPVLGLWLGCCQSSLWPAAGRSATRVTSDTTRFQERCHESS